jgi:hypothetical protein
MNDISEISISKPARIIYGVICTLLIIVGLALYFLYLITVIKTKALRRQYFFQLTIGLGIADCWGLLGMFPVGLPLIFSGENEVNWIPNLTTEIIVGNLVQTIPYFTSVAYVSLIAVNRYVALCWFTTLDVVFTRPTMIGTLIAPWVFGIVYSSLAKICGCSTIFNELGWTLQCGRVLITCGKVCIIIIRRPEAGLTRSFTPFFSTDFNTILLALL